MLRREVVDFHGEIYDVPLPGDGTSGLGIPLKMMLRPLRQDIPIYLAAIGPKNVALATEIADGWLPIFVSPERLRGVFPHLDAAREGFDVAAGVNVVLTKDVEGGREYVKHHLALYVGGMGARGKNFYNALVCRYGYEEAAARIQDLYLGGRARGGRRRSRCARRRGRARRVTGADRRPARSVESLRRDDAHRPEP